MVEYCKNCGNELEEGSVFCNECGTKSGESSPSSVINYNSSDNPFSRYKIDQVTKRLNILGFVLAEFQKPLYLQLEKHFLLNMSKIRAAVVGYGNIGKYVVEALEAAADFEIVGIVRRASSVGGEQMKYPIVSSLESLEDVDVAILCTPSRLVEQSAAEALKLGIATVDSFDIHGDIADMRARLDEIARKHNSAALISAGWDPGSDSVVRALLEICAPQGITYTNFGPGMSMGHTVAVKAVEGVKAALSMTIPLGTGIHRRMVYVELNEGYELAEVAAKIKNDPYFVKDETHVIQVESVEDLKDMGHGVNMIRKGVSGMTQNQRFEFNMSIDNPGLTSQILVAAARAIVRQKPGAYTMIEVPLIDFLAGDRDKIIRRLV